MFNFHRPLCTLPEFKFLISFFIYENLKFWEPHPRSWGVIAIFLYFIWTYKASLQQNHEEQRGRNRLEYVDLFEQLTKASSILLFKIWFTDQQYQHHLGPC